MSANTRKNSAPSGESELDKQFGVVLAKLIEAQVDALVLEPYEMEKAKERLSIAAGIQDTPGKKIPSFGGKRRHKTYRKKRS